MRGGIGGIPELSDRPSRELITAVNEIRRMKAFGTNFIARRTRG
jgi:hypothetical protein